jgi:hypothetical protein
MGVSIQRVFTISPDDLLGKSNINNNVERSPEASMACGSVRSSHPNDRHSLAGAAQARLPRAIDQA